MNARPKFEGEELTLAGTTYVVPALGIRDVKALLPKVQRMRIGEDGLPTDEFLEDACDLIALALRRNYPELERDAVVELLDVKTFPLALQAVFRASGFVAVPVSGGSDGAEGNGSTASPASTTGTPSTPDSAPPSAAPGSTSTTS